MPFIDICFIEKIEENCTYVQFVRIFSNSSIMIFNTSLINQSYFNNYYFYGIKACLIGQRSIDEYNYLQLTFFLAYIAKLRNLNKPINIGFQMFQLTKKICEINQLILKYKTNPNILYESFTFLSDEIYNEYRDAGINFEIHDFPKTTCPSKHWNEYECPIQVYYDNLYRLTGIKIGNVRGNISYELDIILDEKNRERFVIKL